MQTNSPEATQRETTNRAIQVPRVQTNMEIKGSPFKGTASTWYCGDGRILPVESLDSAHLKNIVNYLHTRAGEDLELNNPYPFYVTLDAKKRDVWLTENCITWPALKRLAMQRGIWNSDTMEVNIPEPVQQPWSPALEISTLQRQSSDLIARFNNLEKKVANIEVAQKDQSKLEHIHSKQQTYFGISANLLKHINEHAGLIKALNEKVDKGVIVSFGAGRLGSSEIRIAELERRNENWISTLKDALHRIEVVEKENHSLRAGLMNLEKTQQNQHDVIQDTILKERRIYGRF